MTTIAFDTFGNVAWDSQTTTGSSLRERAAIEKVVVIKGVLYAGAGAKWAIEAFPKWYKSGCKPCDKPSGDWAILVIDKGVMKHFVSEADGGVTVVAPQALGSGEVIATTLMMAGKTAGEAVEMACQLDIYTSGPVHTAKLAALLKRRRKKKAPVKSVAKPVVPRKKLIAKPKVRK